MTAPNGKLTGWKLAATSLCTSPVKSESAGRSSRTCCASASETLMPLHVVAQCTVDDTVEDPLLGATADLWIGLRGRDLLVDEQKREASLPRNRSDEIALAGC